MSAKSWKIILLVLAVTLSGGITGSVPTEDIYARPEKFERSRSFDVLHYRIQLFLDDRNQAFQGETTIRLRSLQEGLTECRLDAVGFTVAVVQGKTGNPLPFRQEPETLLVTLDRDYSWGEECLFTVRYSSREPKRGLKFIAAGPHHPAQVNSYNWPEEARSWIPCFDSPNDKAASEMIVTVRSDWKVLANGRLASVTEDKEKKTGTWRWLQETPHPTYCLTLTAGPYTVINDRLGDLPVSYWVYEEDAADARPIFAPTPGIIGFFNRRFDFPYPWAKYDQICVAGSGGGLENTSATVLGDGTIVDDRGRADFSGLGLIAHELAHQWWGDLVTPRDWSHVWLSESFATYAEYLYMREARGEDEGALNLEEKKNSYLEEAREQYIRPVVFNRYRQPWEVMDSHSYPKGAVILHMLRRIMGDDPFFRSLSHFLKRFQHQSVDTHDLQTVLKDISGQNLDWFFDQWLYKPGHPVFAIAKEWDQANHVLRLQINQVQDQSKGIPVFRLPVRIGIFSAAGQRVEEVWLDKQSETFSFPLPEKPLFVRFDQGNFLLKEIRFPRTPEELAAQLRLDDTVGRSEAARELNPFTADPTVRKRLREAMQHDPFWAVRREALTILGKQPNSDEEPLFLAMTADPDSRVRAAAYKIMTHFRPRTRFLQDRFRSERSYLVQAEIIRALGECAGPEIIPFLDRAAATRSPRQILARTAVAARQRIRSR